MTLRRWCVVSLVDKGDRDMREGALLGMLAEGLHRFMQAAGMTVVSGGRRCSAGAVPPGALLRSYAVAWIPCCTSLNT